MHKHLLIISSIFSFLLTGCNVVSITENEGVSEGSGALNIVIDQTCSPKDIENWPVYVFLFKNDTCSFASEYSSLKECSKTDISKGDRISVVAVEDKSNVDFSCLAEKYKSASYWIYPQKKKADMAQIWAANANIPEGAESISQILYPVTSQLTLLAKNAPGTFKHISLKTSGFCDKFEIGSNSCSTKNNDRICELTCTGDTVKTYFLPSQEGNNVVEFTLEIVLQDETITSEIKVDPKAFQRSCLNIEVDFKDFEAQQTIDITSRRYNLLNPGKVTTESKTVKGGLTADLLKGRYIVQVKNGEGWQYRPIHDALCSDANKHGNIWNDWNNNKRMRDTMAFCIIDTEFPATIRVKKGKGSFSNAKVRPSVYNIPVSDLGNNTIEFTIPSEDMGKVSVEFDNDRQHNLFIYARRPDTSKPQKNAPKVIYYEKGEHRPGTIYLNEGQTLYIDTDAKVYANVKTSGSNVTIAGHGILSGEEMIHTGDNQYSWGDFLINCNQSKGLARNLTIKDITMIDSPGWNLIIPNTDNVLIDGVNMISWELNGDGIDIVSSRDVTIRNCFIRTYDDCITLKCRFIVNPIKDVSNVKISKCLIWADYARGIVIGPEAGNLYNNGYIHDVSVTDCIFLQHKRGLNDDLRAAFAIGQGSDGSTSLWSGNNPPRSITDVNASNLVFDDIDKTGRNVAIWQYGSSPVTMSNVNLTNFRIINNNGNNYPAFEIKTMGSSIYNMTVSDFTINGKEVTKIGSDIKIDNAAKVDIKFK